MSLPVGSELSSTQLQSLEQVLLPVRDFLALCPPDTTHWVACSGGLDSVLLLWAMASLAPGQTQAIHIDHGLHPQASVWSQHVSSLCQAWQIPCVTHSVNMTQSAGNIEARARAERYRVFAEQLKAQDVLWLGHHLNDQIETFFLRLIRGSGMTGLAGMPRQRPVGDGVLFRPWLETPRSVLATIAQSLNLSWVEDPANDSLDFDRNFIRHNVLPILTQRWPQTLPRFLNTQQHLTAAAHELQDLHNAHLAKIVAADGGLEIEPWLGCGNEALQLSLLRQWWCNLGEQAPSLQQLQQARRQVALSRPDAQGRVRLGQSDLRRFQNRLYCVQPLPALPPSLSFTGNLSTGLLAVHPGMGRLHLEPCVGEGLSLAKLNVLPVIQFRQGGEVMRPKGRGHRRDCKRLMQEFSIAPWWRDRVPLLYVGATWVAMAGYCVDADWATQPEEPGLRVCWQP